MARLSDPFSRRNADRRLRRAPDRGVTVVELLMASLIVGLGVMGVSGLFVASARSTAVAEHQADATDIATGELEIIRSLPYEDIGIATSAPGYVPTVDGRPTVTETGANLVAPVGVVSRRGVDFQIERSVTWITAGVSDRSYKLVVVTVDWETEDGQRSIRLQTGVYEGASRG